MVKKLSKRRFTLLIIGIAIVLGASLPPFMTASCLTQQTPAEARALESLRNVTRGGQLPPEDVVAKIESDFRGTRAAGLAKIVHARIKLAANDYAGAAALLDSSTIRDYTSLGDYALFMRGQAFEQTGQVADARRVYEQLLTSYPSSSRARIARLRIADLALKAGNAAAIPGGLQEQANKNDAGEY